MMKYQDGVRIYPTGKKAFVLFYRASGRQRLMTLGDYGRYTVDEARNWRVSIWYPWTVA
jgi:hypothetical protein